MRSPITQVLVPGRGHQLTPEGSLVLSESAIARVQTAADYYYANRSAFYEQAGQIVFEGGWAAAATGIPKPMEDFREGRLMRLLAKDLGVAPVHAVESIESVTTMTNCLNAARFFSGVDKLAIVSQASQAERFIYCAQKAMPGVRVTIIEAPGETDPAQIEEEQELLRQSQLLYGLARGPRALRAADRAGMLAGKLLGKKPGETYAQTF